MKQLLKDNFALVAAIVLPLVLALIFMLSTVFVRVTVADPQYDFLVATNYYENDNNNFHFTVSNNSLRVTYYPDRKNKRGEYMNMNMPRLWRVHVPEMSVEEIALNMPDTQAQVNISIPGITDVQVQNIQPGPDGYSFTNSYAYNGSLMSDFFGGHRNRNTAGIAKDGRMVAVNVPSMEQWGYNSRFIGWITQTP